MYTDNLEVACEKAGMDDMILWTWNATCLLGGHEILKVFIEVAHAVD